MLHAYTLDASGGLPVGVTAPALPDSTPGLYLVVLRSLPKPEWLDALGKVATSVVGYVPSNSYLVYAPLAALKHLGDDAAPVINILPFAPAFKLLDLDTLSLDSSWAPVVVNLANVAGAETAKSLMQATALPAAYGELVLPTVTQVWARLPESDLAGLATIPEVVSIEPMAPLVLSGERQALTVAGQETQVSGTYQPSCSQDYYTWLSGVLPSGTSPIHIGILDTGLDTGTAGGTNIHPDLKASNGQSRVYGNIAIAAGNPSPADCTGHGTLVAAVAAGSGGRGAPYPDPSTRYGESFGPCAGSTTCSSAGNCFWGDSGIAPDAMVSSVRIFDDDANTNDMGPFLTNLEGIFEYFATWGVWVANLSSNEEDTSAYTALTSALDYKVRRAHASIFGGPDQWKPIAIVVSAGNKNNQNNFQTVLAPATGKNVIAVGASENVNPFRPFGNGCSAAGDYDSTHDIASFSNHGQSASDLRVKPDLVAPGTNVTGALTRVNYYVPPPGPYCWKNDVCTRADNEGALWGLRSTDGIGWSQGTSFAAPAVTGAAGLVSLWWSSWPGHTAQASPAMMKAMLLSSALDLNGGARVVGDGIPSDYQGWGKVDLRDSFPPPSRRFGHDQGYLFTASGGPDWTGVFKVHLPDANAKVDVTLVWTDAYGERYAGFPLRNDLDLSIASAGGNYWGNVFNGDTGYSLQNPTNPTLRDRRNNVERARFAAADLSTFTVYVTPTLINSKGVPSDLYHNLNQDFALFIRNACAMGAQGCN